MSFMMEIDASRPSPLERLAVDYLTLRSGNPSPEFCRLALGVQVEDKVIARRLGVAISTVRGWRELGRRAS